MIKVLYDYSIKIATTHFN